MLHSLLRLDRILHLSGGHGTYKPLILVLALKSTVLAALVHVAHVDRRVDAPLKVQNMSVRVIGPGQNHARVRGHL